VTISPTPHSFLLFSQTADAIAATTKKLEKIRILSDYLRSLSAEDASTAAIFFTGRPFPRWEERVLSVGGSILWNAVERIANPDAGRAHKTYLKHGDLGDMANELLAAHRATGQPRPQTGQLSLHHVASALNNLAALRGNGVKLLAVEELLRRAHPLEAKYIVKIITGDLRIGLRESLVEEAIAQAFAKPAGDVRRANMLLGDIAATLRLAAADELLTARLRLLHPIGFMLASPVDTPSEALEYFPEGALVEDKFDGIRAQAHKEVHKEVHREVHNEVHKTGRAVKLFSRTLDEISEFPELYAALAALPGEFILDGEIIAWRDGRPLPFTELQKRLGRKQPDMWLLQDIPACFVAFDLLYADGELLLDRPLAERRARLALLFSGESDAAGATPSVIAAPVAPHLGSVVEGVVAAHFSAPSSFAPSSSAPSSSAPSSSAPSSPAPSSPPPSSNASLLAPTTLLLAPAQRCATPEDMEKAFLDSRQRGHEGIMLKDPASPYKPGQRGRHWLKLKRPLATLDVVVTSVEYGHGKRRGLLSDYTFAVRDNDDRLVNIGKAYSGLTDAEIRQYTDYFLQHTVEDFGSWRRVDPTLVLEVAFNNIQQSSRHESGYALRFPRILRIRTDKSPAEIDTLDRVREIFAKQGTVSAVE
jgi:DNA ligase-1